MALDNFKTFLNDVIGCAKGYGLGIDLSIIDPTHFIGLDEKISFINNIDTEKIAKDIAERCVTLKNFSYSVELDIINNKFNLLLPLLAKIEDIDVLTRLNKIHILSKMAIEDIDIIINEKFSDQVFYRKPFNNMITTIEGGLSQAKNEAVDYLLKHAGIVKETETYNDHVPQDELKNISLFIKNVIIESNTLGWQKFFFNETDFNNCVDYVSKYLKTEKVCDPSASIKIIKGQKSTLARLFNIIYKRYGIKNNLKNDIGYFTILKKIIIDFKGYDDHGLYKLITK